MDRAALALHWQALGAELALDAPVLDAWRREGGKLLRHWNAWPRRYHDLHHLAACLRHLGGMRDSLDDPQAVALALWFHDAVYWPWRGDNEQRSADWATRFLPCVGLAAERIDAVHQMVMDTCHGAPPRTHDARWLVDIDLAILGQPVDVYQAFEKNVRAEYRFVRWKRYTAGRGAVLRGFLARSAIYTTPYFQERLEAPARANLARAIAALEAGRLDA